jgi:hypothetical protein
MLAPYLVVLAAAVLCLATFRLVIGIWRIWATRAHNTPKENRVSLWLATIISALLAILAILLLVFSSLRQDKKPLPILLLITWSLLMVCHVGDLNYCIEVILTCLQGNISITLLPPLSAASIGSMDNISTLLRLFDCT